MNRASFILGLSLSATLAVAGCAADPISTDEMPVKPDLAATAPSRPETPKAETPQSKPTEVIAPTTNATTDAPAAEPRAEEPAAPARARVFVTRDRFAGDLMRIGEGYDGLDGADRLCQKAADAAKLGGKFKAWLSTSSVHAIDRIDDRAPWYLVDGRTLAFASKQSLREQPEVRIDMNETGGAFHLGLNYAWTGTRNGQHDKKTCYNWTSANGDHRATVGMYVTTEAWTKGLLDGHCDEAQALYCFEQ